MKPGLRSPQALGAWGARHQPWGTEAGHQLEQPAAVPLARAGAPSREPILASARTSSRAGGCGRAIRFGTFMTRGAFLAMVSAGGRSRPRLEDLLEPAPAVELTVRPFEPCAAVQRDPRSPCRHRRDDGPRPADHPPRDQGSVCAQGHGPRPGEAPVGFLGEALSFARGAGSEARTPPIGSVPVETQMKSELLDDLRNEIGLLRVVSAEASSAKLPASALPASPQPLMAWQALLSFAARPS